MAGRGQGWGALGTHGRLASRIQRMNPGRKLKEPEEQMHSIGLSNQTKGPPPLTPPRRADARGEGNLESCASPSASGERGRTLTGRAVFIWLVAFFAIVFFANGVMMKLAFDTMSGTEVDSAYRASLAFNAEAQAARRQDERAWRVNSHAARNADGDAVLRVEARDKAGVPLTGLSFSAALERPTDKRADRHIVLGELQTGLYGGKAADVAPGQWDLVLAAERGGERLFV